MEEAINQQVEALGDLIRVAALLKEALDWVVQQLDIMALVAEVDGMAEVELLLMALEVADLATSIRQN